MRSRSTVSRFVRSRHTPDGPGRPAKPVIDIVLEVPDGPDRTDPLVTVWRNTEVREFEGEAGQPARSRVHLRLGFHPRELFANDLIRGRGPRETHVDGEERDDRVELVRRDP